MFFQSNTIISFHGSQNTHNIQVFWPTIHKESPSKMGKRAGMVNCFLSIRVLLLLLRPGKIWEIGTLLGPRDRESGAMVLMVFNCHHHRRSKGKKGSQLFSTLDHRPRKSLSNALSKQAGKQAALSLSLHGQTQHTQVDVHKTKN